MNDEFSTLFFINGYFMPKSRINSELTKMPQCYYWGIFYASMR